MTINTLYPKFSRRKENDTMMIMEQRLLTSVSQLILDTSRCAGCGICVESCPKDAIVLQHAGVLRGRGAILVDPAICSYCSICSILCPLKALKITVNGAETLPIIDNEGFPQFDYTAQIDETKCKRCTVCSEACPEDAIVRDVPVFEGQDPAGAKRQSALTANITMVICLHKCTVCGVCASLCPALTIKHRRFDPEKMLFGQAGCPAEKNGIKCDSQSGEIKWEKSFCDACGVCVAACPEKAILEVTRNLTKDPVLPGKVTINKDKCVACRWCDELCPSDAVVVTKFFEGEIIVDTAKCQEGCNACVDVCPCRAFYVTIPKAEKGKKTGKGKGKSFKKAYVAVNQDLCILCGACVYACPGEQALTIQRKGINVKGMETDMFKTIAAKLCTPRTSAGVEKTEDAATVEE